MLCYEQKTLLNSMELNIIWEATEAIDFQHFIESVALLPDLQALSICPYPKSDQIWSTPCNYVYTRSI
jgi:hypothetical protein